MENVKENSDISKFFKILTKNSFKKFNIYKKFC